MEHRAWDGTRERQREREEEEKLARQTQQRRRRKKGKRGEHEGDIVAENVYIHVRLAACAYIRQCNVSIELHHHHHRITSI